MPNDLEKQNVRRLQGRLGAEPEMLASGFLGAPRSPSTPGINKTEQLALANGFEVFHKAFTGVNRTYAHAYGQGLETPPLHECAAWRLATELGDPYDEIVVPCVLREVSGEDGSLILQAPGEPNRPEPLEDPRWCDPAAFFDSLIAQQDRHSGNYRWDGARLSLYDHGYSFARPGDHDQNGVFVEQRHRQGRAVLQESERQVLHRLLDSPSLLGLALLLEPDRADALHSRVERMLVSGGVLAWGDF